MAWSMHGPETNIKSGLTGLKSTCSLHTAEIDQAQTWLPHQNIHSCWQFDAAATSVATMHQAGSQRPPDASNAFAVFMQTGTISSRPTAWLQPLDTVTSCCTQGRVWSVSGHATCSSDLASLLSTWYAVCHKACQPGTSLARFLSWSRSNIMLMQYSATVEVLALNRCFSYDDRLTVSSGLFSCLVLTCVTAKLVTADDGCADGAS